MDMAAHFSSWAAKEGTCDRNVETCRTVMFGRKKWKRNRLPLAWHYVRMTMYHKCPNTGLVVPLQISLYLETVGSYCLN